ncbi:disulfide bond formation protein B [Reyranella sp.]|uniref:disulfide bond formation protein B n=1 Tax=Reyranella sp. TaxID=1929291 RepID=UPI003BAA36A8
MTGLVRFGNGLAVAAIAALLIASFVWQVALAELPCPLCLLQRTAFALVAFGFVLNLRFGVQPMHYGLSLLAALLGLAMAVRQMMLHITPGDGGFGSAFLGLHLYTWAAIAFLATIAGIAVLMILGGRPDPDRNDHVASLRFRGLSRFFVYLLIVVTLVQAAGSFAQCGPVDCPDDPTGYWIARFMPGSLS